MHELAITQSLLDLALRHAQAAEAARITDLHLVIGDLSSVIDDSVQFHWDILSHDTLAEGAQLHFDRIPATLHCFDCNEDYQPQRGELACPACDGVMVKVVAGDEFRLDSIEIDERT